MGINKITFLWHQPKLQTETLLSSSLPLTRPLTRPHQARAVLVAVWMYLSLYKSGFNAGSFSQIKYISVKTRIHNYFAVNIY